TNWAVDFPKATSQLLRVIARDPETSFELAAAVLGTRVMQAGSRGEDTDDVLVAAFPRLRGPLRDAAADRPGVRELVGLAEGVGYESIPEPDPSWLWPADKTFPPADTIEGVQARLNFIDLGAGPIDGEWSELTRRAFVRWQVLNGFEPTGELDDDSISRISFDAPE
ncbi:MAG TPA: peptidoglycan-binding domain-containing protein, partial [Kofleriaceae bacterium]